LELLFGAARLLVQGTFSVVAMLWSQKRSLVERIKAVD